MSQGEKNVYVCERCSHYTVTIDVDEGVTPMFLACRADGELEPTCGGTGQSLMYPPEPWPDGVPTTPQFEWYRPSQKELVELGWGEIEHVNKGGLLLRKVTP